MKRQMVGWGILVLGIALTFGIGEPVWSEDQARDRERVESQARTQEQQQEQIREQERQRIESQTQEQKKQQMQEQPKIKKGGQSHAPGGRSKGGRGR